MTVTNGLALQAADFYVRAVHPSTGDPVARNLVAQALTAATDGATILRTGLPYSGTGIIVALPEHGFRVAYSWPDDPTHLEYLVGEWVWEVSAAVTETSLRPRAFGAWRDGDQVYLDVVEVFPADQEAEAVAAGRARNQIAVWHAGRGEEIPTGGNGQ